MKKAWIIVAIVLTALGAAIFTGALFAARFDFSKFSWGDREMTEKEYQVTRDFRSIDIRTDVTDIEFKVSPDGIFKAVAKEPAKMTHKVEVVDGTLRIESVDERKWFEHLWGWKAPSMTIYLPAKDPGYEMLRIDNNTGDVRIPKDFCFIGVEAETTTGDVTYSGQTLGVLKIKTSTGDIRANDFFAYAMDLSVSTGKITLRNGAVPGNLLSSVPAVSSGEVTIHVGTGSVEIEEFTCGCFSSTGSTGSIRLKNFKAHYDVSIQRNTGDIHLENVDSLQGSITLKTSTGDIRGTLSSGKIFTAKSSTGHVRVPDSTAGGKCEITTSTGDIDIRVE